jgi:AcrR family transcriptional regulator
VTGGRRGRRPGGPDTRAAILAAARQRFAEQGYAAASVRSIAAAAGVDSALVHHYFGTKEDLFLASLQLTFDPREVIGSMVGSGAAASAAGGAGAPSPAGPDDAGERLMRLFVTVWDDETTRQPLLALVRGIVEPDGRLLVRDAFLRMVLTPLAAGLGVDEPERRMPLVASQLIGLVMLRYVLAVEPLASAPAEELVAIYAPTLQRYLTGPLP